MRLRNFIMAASAVVSVLFIGGTYLVLDRVFDQSIKAEASQSSRAMARVTFNAMYELMSTGWNRAQLHSFLDAMSRATADTPTTLRIHRGALVAERFGEIPQDPADIILRQALSDGQTRESTVGNRIRYTFPLRAEQKCLGCHVNARAGETLGVIDVEHDVSARLLASRREFLSWAGLVVPAALAIAALMVWRVRRRIEDPLDQLTHGIQAINDISDLRQIKAINRTSGIREFDELFSSFDRLIQRVRNIAVDKNILQFEIGLLEKFVITSDVVRDWREYVARLLADINQVVTAHVLFSIFKVDEELFELEVFWRCQPGDDTRTMVEHYIREAIDRNSGMGDLTTVRIHHHFHVEPAATLIELSEEEVRLHVKAFFVDKPKIGGIVGIGVHADVLSDSTLRLVMDSILSTLMNVVGSVKAIYKYTRDLEYYATRDPLTNLFNQRVFWELLDYERQRAQRHAYAFAVLLLDLDNFKLVNDGYGHSFGDKFLQTFAETVGASLRNGDIFARYGGDEFAVVLPETAMDDAVLVARRILEATDGMVLTAPDGTLVHGAASIGLAMYPQHASDTRDLFMFADNMMYKAKAEGKGRVAVPSGQDVVDVFRDITQNGVLVIKAIDDKRVIPFFQPIVATASHEIAAYEVLSRLEVDGRIVAASDFIEVAEKMGVIHRIDTLVIERALQEVVEQNHQGQIFLNLSPRALVISEFTRNILSLVNGSSISPERIVFEITERDTIKNLTLLERFLMDLKFEGFKLAIDDFGSGFSSFHYLRRFPIDYLKIEGDFIANMRNSTKDRAFVHSMHMLAYELNIKTIAEFVEDAEVLAELRQLGIDYAQGYHMGRPSRHILPSSHWQPAV
ncbi:EAL domain-containing protein [Denitratisoma oestradiolicum]|uniref:GGDEF-domain containing protein n=1 Tax=Denitratisoma oestradiolicum TaxID=311182 RepID=A0A6S6XWN9_9PROT|nr:EAL domain-containing protein [Denitratisoma oestradiolicum]TWO79683.1 diguanylate cyclase [Denitratisoma oestradiolicum]CAB1370439.1 GGDEF-domain containing protein [Denitratisoma oestradiolicum]